MRRIKRSKKRGPVQSKKVTHDGITFASGLEKYMYIALKDSKIKAHYEHRTFVLIPGFYFDHESYERTANAKGAFKDRGKKSIQPIKYTPDFEGEGFIIECKGRANETFSMRWKLFKKLITEQIPGIVLYKPQNQKECDKTVELILESQKRLRGKNIEKDK